MRSADIPDEDTYQAVTALTNLLSISVDEALTAISALRESGWGSPTDISGHILDARKRATQENEDSFNQVMSNMVTAIAEVNASVTNLHEEFEQFAESVKELKNNSSPVGNITYPSYPGRPVSDSETSRLIAGILSRRG